MLHVIELALQAFKQVLELVFLLDSSLELFLVYPYLSAKSFETTYDCCLVLLVHNTLNLGQSW